MRTLLILLLVCPILHAQDINGVVKDNNGGIPFVKIKLFELEKYTLSNDDGSFQFNNISLDTVSISFSAVGYTDTTVKVIAPFKSIEIQLTSIIQDVDEVVVTGSMKEVSKKESVTNVEVLRPSFFKKNPTPSVYDAMQNVNGVRPQLNCSVCNTGDIHINGLEGSYTMVMIDGMPIVSSLSTVYGLTGIPNSLVERIEIVKGPASALYGSEAIGGVINIITKNPENADKLAVDIFSTTWLEHSADLALKANIGQKASVLTGINYYNYNYIQDQNNDGFTDVTLQDRISIFQKWGFRRKSNKLFSLAGRYYYEDRWGGETNWNSNFRGGDSIYGESIYTSRWEVLGIYQLPGKENIFLTTSVNRHQQNSVYGNVPYIADQFIAFGQIYWDKKIGKNDLLIGSALRYTQYDDNTPATFSSDSLNPQNSPSKVLLPGIYIQDEIQLKKEHKLLLSARIDHHSEHGAIFTPRIGYKGTFKETIIRLNLGSGYRVVNIFTEDHAALTGARKVIISENIAPETSYNANLNVNRSFITKKRRYFNIDLSVFYTYFDNRIIADYDTDPNLIIYENLNSYGINRGVSMNITARPINKMKIMVGCTYMDVLTFENGYAEQQILTEKFTGTWSVTYNFTKFLSFDYTGNVYSPMRLPLLNESDPRAEYSPWWSIQNIQFTYSKIKNFEIYFGVKNLLNWTPNKNTAFIIARSHDPFDKNVNYDSSGNVTPTNENPYALTFDPSYVYAPNQGIRGFAGIRYTLK